MASSYSGEARITEGYENTVSAARFQAAEAEAAVGNPKEIIARLRQSLPKGTSVEGSFAKGGVVPKTAPYLLHKGEQVVPASETDQTQQAAPDAAQTPPAQDDSNLPDDEEAGSGGSIKIQRAFSKLQLALTKLEDESGVHRSATIPYVHGEDMHLHVEAVGQAVRQVGDSTANLITTHHHTGGRGWDTDRTRNGFRRVRESSGTVGAP